MARCFYWVGKGRAVYGAKDIDFLVAHVIPLDVWYVLPVELCMPSPMLRFYPHRKGKKMCLERYREAWHLMKPGVPARSVLFFLRVSVGTVFAKCEPSARNEKALALARAVVLQDRRLL